MSHRQQSLPLDSPFSSELVSQDFFVLRWEGDTSKQVRIFVGDKGEIQ
jgi:hypothetical protein